MNVLEREKSESFGAVPDVAPYLLDAFRSLDLNGDGIVSQDEFVQILSKLLPEVWTIDKISNLINVIDCNHDGCIQYQEFVKWCCSEEAPMLSPSTSVAFDHALQILSGTCYQGLLLHFDAGTLPDPQADQEHVARLRGKLPVPADGLKSWETIGHRPLFAWEFRLDDARAKAWSPMRSSRAQTLEPPCALPTTSFTIGLCLRRRPGNKAITLFQFSCGRSVAFDSDGVLFCPVRKRESSIILPSCNWLMLLLDISERTCNVFAAWDVHGFCNVGEIDDSLGGKTLCSIGAAEAFDWEDDPGVCQIAKFLVWNRTLSETERFQFFTSSAPRFGLVMATEARELSFGRPVPRTSWQNEEYVRLLECALAGGEPRGVANFSGLRVNDADLPEIIEAVTKGKVKQLRLVDVQITSEGIEVLLAAFNKESDTQLFLTGCRAVAEISCEVLDRYPDAQISSLGKETCCFESFDICRFRNMIKTNAKQPTSMSKPIIHAKAIEEPALAGSSAVTGSTVGVVAPSPEELERTLSSPIHAGKCSAGIRLRADPSTGFQKVETLARDTPEVHATSPEKLAAYCSEVADTDILKAWYIFSWNVYHIDYHCDAYDDASQRLDGSAEGVLKQFAKHKKRLALCDGYSRTFHRIAELAGLKALYISGHARNLTRTVDQDIIADGVGGHGWNAIQIDGSWLLVDSTWGAGSCYDRKFERSFEPYWFGVQPEEMAFTHFPKEPQSQFLRDPITYETFISQPIVEICSFFGRGCKFEELSRPCGTIVLEESNQGSLRLKVPKNVVGLSAKIGPGIKSNSMSSDGCYCVRNRNTVAVNFRVPCGDKIHTFELWIDNPNNPLFSECCAKLHVRGPAHPAQFIEPYFPTVNAAAVYANSIRFAEELPSGILRCGETNRASVTVHAPQTTIFMPEVESQGVNSSILLQHEKDSVTMLATCPEGEHRLNLYAKQRTDESTMSPFAVGWKITVPPGCKITDRLPKTYTKWNHFRGFLESPLSGKLKSGEQHFRLCFDQNLLGKRKLLVTCGESQTELKDNEGFFEGDVNLTAPAAEIVYIEDGWLHSLVQYEVT